MQALDYLLAGLIFCGVYALGSCVYALGSWRTGSARQWQRLRLHRPGIWKTFRVGGGIFQAMGAVVAFLEAVAVVIVGSALAF